MVTTELYDKIAETLTPEKREVINANLEAIREDLTRTFSRLSEHYGDLVQMARHSKSDDDYEIKIRISPNANLEIKKFNQKVISYVKDRGCQSNISFEIDRLTDHSMLQGKIELLGISHENVNDPADKLQGRFDGLTFTEDFTSNDYWGVTSFMANSKTHHGDLEYKAPILPAREDATDDDLNRILKELKKCTHLRMSATPVLEALRSLCTYLDTSQTVTLNNFAAAFGIK